MRVLGLTVWLDRVAVVGLPYRLVELAIVIAKTNWHNDHIHEHIHQSQMCKLECNL